MKQTSVEAIRAAVSTLLLDARKTPIPQEGQWLYQRGPSGWNGSFVQRPGTYNLLSPHEPLIDTLSEALEPVLKVDYPDHMERTGTSMSAGVLQPRMILGHLAYESFKRFGTFAISDEQINELVADAALFFDRSDIRLRLSAPVLNVHGPRDVAPITFPGGVIMRPITDEEFTDIYGGNPIFRGGGRTFQFPDFVFIRDIEIPKLVGKNQEMTGDPFWQPTQELLERCILALASFKDGSAAGYDGIRVTPLEMAFGAAFGISQLWGNEHVPVGRYELSPQEAPHLEAHAALFEGIHASLEIACQRLVDSGRRTKLRAGIVDAVIGLESILLNEIGEQQRGETRFRFSLNYASLFPSTERMDAFNTARDLYDLRSAIAHGSQPKAKVKINGKELTLFEIAPLARSVLRATLMKFMQKSASPDFLAKGYWVEKALGL